MRRWFIPTALVALCMPMLGCCYGPGLSDPCVGGVAPCGGYGYDQCGGCGGCGNYPGGYGQCGLGQGVCCLIGQVVGCVGSGISCVGRELSCLGQAACAGGGTCAPYAADPCYSSCVPQTFDTYAPIGGCAAPMPLGGCAAPAPVGGCAAPFPAAPQPEYMPMPTYMVPGSTPMPIQPPMQQPTPLPGLTPAPADTPVPAPQEAMYYNSTALPHAMHSHTHPHYQTAELPHGPQIQTPPELQPARPILTVPAETQSAPQHAPPQAPPVQDYPLPTIQPGSHYVPTGAATKPGPIRQVAAETRWSRGF